jgi:hypothetical protein
MSAPMDTTTLIQHAASRKKWLDDELVRLSDTIQEHQDELKTLTQVIGKLSPTPYISPTTAPPPATTRLDRQAVADQSSWSGIKATRTRNAISSVLQQAKGCYLSAQDIAARSQGRLSEKSVSDFFHRHCHMRKKMNKPAVFSRIKIRRPSDRKRVYGYQFSNSHPLYFTTKDTP